MKRILKRILKIIVVVMGVLLIASLVLYVVYDQPVPEGKNPAEADLLAQKMLAAIHNEAYEQTTLIEWSFPNGSHRYKWDKANGKVKVTWKDYEVDLNLKQPNKSSVFELQKVVTGKKKEQLIETAITYFNNDSFWLVAPFKVFDQGTERSIVELEDGSKGLLVTYTSGGTTPGDSYVWKLQPNGFPISFQIWASIIPIGGLEATWDDWKVMETNVWLPQSHKIGPFTVTIGGVRAY